MYEKLIAEATELCNAATAGPWIRSKFGCNILTHDSEISTATQKYEGPSAYMDDQIARLVANAEFIARSRTLIPQLVEALKESQRREHEAIADLSGHCEYCAFRSDCAKHDNNDSEAGFTWWTDCKDWKWRGTQGGETDGN